MGTCPFRPPDDLNVSGTRDYINVSGTRDYINVSGTRDDINVSGTRDDINVNTNRTRPTIAPGNLQPRRPVPNRGESLCVST